MLDHYLKMEHITKSFSGVKALDDVSFSVKKGEVHALVGENGAGKSTLMKILCGVYPYHQYSGRLILNGVEQRFSGTRESEKAGIAIIYQELNLIKGLSVCENIFLGNEIFKMPSIQWNAQHKRTMELLETVRLDVAPSVEVGVLGVGKQQLVEIAKALNKDAELIILDEPTASLTEMEVDHLIEILEQLKQAGKTCIYISHKLNEIFRIADSITVLRDGRTVASMNVSEVNEEKLISMMVGRELTQLYPKARHTPGRVMMEVKNWSVEHPTITGKRLVDEVNIEIRQGEILGIAGLMGAGRTELALSLFGLMKPTGTSSLAIDDRKAVFRSPSQAIQGGLSYLSEDRKRYGLVGEQSVLFNMSLASLKGLCRSGVLDRNQEIVRTHKMAGDLQIKLQSMGQKVKTLSGGNQQKVVLGKWIFTQPKVLIVDEPTRGVDVGAKYEIYQIMNELVGQGVCIVMISSELPEILGMSDRIYVMCEGRINGELMREEATQEKILYFAAGGGQQYEQIGK